MISSSKIELQDHSRSLALVLVLLPFNRSHMISS